MTLEQQLIVAVGALWVVVQALSGVVYKQLVERIKEKDTRIATLETEAREMGKAKDAEKDEWRRLAMASLGKPS